MPAASQECGLQKTAGDQEEAGSEDSGMRIPLYVISLYSLLDNQVIPCGTGGGVKILDIIQESMAQGRARTTPMAFLCWPGSTEVQCVDNINKKERPASSLSRKQSLPLSMIT